MNVSEESREGRKEVPALEMGDVLIFNNLLLTFMSFFFPKISPCTGADEAFSHFFLKRERKDFHLNYNLEIFFRASLLACRTLFTKILRPVKKYF